VADHGKGKCAVDPCPKHGPVKKGKGMGKGGSGGGHAGLGQGA